MDIRQSRGDNQGENVRIKYFALDQIENIDPPCSRSLTCMKKASLADLKLGANNASLYVLLKVVKSLIIDDETLELVYDGRSSAMLRWHLGHDQHMLSTGESIAVKQLFVERISGIRTVRIDHLSDIVRLNELDQATLKSLETSELETSASEIRSDRPKRELAASCIMLTGCEPLSVIPCMIKLSAG